MTFLEKLVGQLAYNPDDRLLFNSGFFIYFFFVFILTFYALRRHRTARVWMFSIFSLYFFYKACGWYVGLIVFSAVINFALSNLIYRQSSKQRKKALLILSVVLNLGMLFYFKYTNFFISILDDFSAGHIAALQILLPIGISFYTFENLSYTIDVYRGHFKPVKQFGNYLFFLSFFPKLVMGPIVRAADFIPQISKPHHISNADFAKGFYLIISGLFKKVISDYININFVAYIFDDPSRHSGLECLLAVYGYAMVIYCDFSGYSDMAIGLARWLGFNIPPNFDSPYQSKSITEFWRRWHISLSSWLRDYVYIPLGGNRKGKVRTYINLFFTMLIGGFWHGASWNFIIWGALHGGGLALDKLRISYFKKTNPGRLASAFGIFLTFHFVCFCWIFFRAETLAQAQTIFSQLSTNFDAASLLRLFAAYRNVFGLLAIGFLLHYIPSCWEKRIIYCMESFNLVLYILIFIAFLFLFMQIKTAEMVMPVYLQF